MLVRQPWSTSSLPCASWIAGGWVVWRCGSSASGGTSGRRSRKVVLAELWLECEQWYIGTAVSEGGVGLLDVAELMDVGAAAPKACQS
jgi:hypothetical protein